VSLDIGVDPRKPAVGVSWHAAVAHADGGQPDDSNLLGQQNNRCWNIQWLLLILGVLFHIPSIVASFLPLCRFPRFPNKSYRWEPQSAVPYHVVCSAVQYCGRVFSAAKH
jgi:hypothetical protein